MIKKIFNVLLSSASVCAVQTSAWAQDAWQFQSSLTGTTGYYSDSFSLKNQKGLGLRLSGEKNQAWGVTAGLQTTHIGMQPIVPVYQKNQDDWMLSGFFHIPSLVFPGRLTLQLDAYKTINNATQDISSDVQAFVPQAIWQSYTLPLKIDLSHAQSKYKNTDNIYQTSAGLAIGFNGAKDWLHFRGYKVRNLTPGSALGLTHSSAAEIKLTHLFTSKSTWTPTYFSLGLERGKKIYSIDVVSQTMYNLPMVNEGGENITVSWKLSPKTDLNLYLSRNQYLSDQPWVHRFALNTLSAQIAKKW